MRITSSILAAALLLGATPMLASERSTRAAAKLERALEGRVAGAPVDCIQLRSIRSSQIIDRTAILYEAGNGTIYVNRPEGGASSLDKWDILVTDTHSSRLCSIDVVRLYDSGARMPTGFVSLGEFVPYKKAASEK